MICEKESDCPLLPVHRRLEESAQLWIQSSESYFHPQSFAPNLNSCIQSLRNVTWILQSNKSKIPEFETWYGKWQLKMKEDDLLLWCVAARNRIVKQGDLETKSIARVSIMASYNLPPYSEFQVPPFLPAEVIASNIQLQNIPQEILKTGVFLVERRWIAADLPNVEILDALAHVYGFLTSLVEDAHNQIGVRMKRGGILEPEDGRIPEMMSTDYRSTYVKLSTGEFLSPRIDILEPNIEEARARYGAPPGLEGNKPSVQVTLAERANHCFEMAQRILRKDGTHGHIAILVLPDGRSRVLLVSASDRSDKYLLMSDVAKEVDRVGATAVIVIAEAWFAPYDPEHPERHAIDSPDRCESLMLSAISSDNEEVHLVALFERTDKEIEIGPTQETERGESSFLDPIRRVWAKMA